MTLQTTGKINFSQIGVEVGQPLLSPVSLDSIELRKLANKTASHSQISANDFYGRQFGVGAGYALLDFTALADLIPSTVVYSNVIYAPVDSSIAIFCSSAAAYRINNGAWQDKSVLGDVLAGQSIEIRCTASASFGTATPVTVNLGGSIKMFSVITGTKKTTQIGVYARCTANFGYDAYGHRDEVTNSHVEWQIGYAIQANAVDLGELVWNSALGGYYKVYDLKTIATYASTYTQDSWTVKGYLTIPSMETENPGIAAAASHDSMYAGQGVGNGGIVRLLGVNYSFQITCSTNHAAFGQTWANFSGSYSLTPV